MRMRVIVARLGGLFGRRKADQDFDEEMRMHLQLLTEQAIRRGLSPEEALFAARRQFGNIPLLQQSQREMRSMMSLANLGRDLRFAARQLRRSPSLATIAVVSLALGIGANTAIFTIAKKVLLDSLPVKNPQDLRLLTWVSGHQQPVPPVWGDVGATEEGGLSSTAFSYPVLEELRKKTEVFADLIAFKPIPLTVTVDGNPELIDAEMVSGNAFSGRGAACWPPPHACRRYGAGQGPSGRN